MSSNALLNQRPLQLNAAELTAGLRAFMSDSSLVVTQIDELPFENRLPTMGRLRGLKVTYRCSSEKREIELVLKEPMGISRAGMVGGGRRELMVYRMLADQIPFRTPSLVAANVDGDWIATQLVTGGRDATRWTARDYLLATDKLVALHDRFWNLGADLAIYNWLGRPLEGDFQVYARAASQGIQRMLSAQEGTRLTEDIELVMALNRLVKRADRVAAVLRAIPATLIHGDYWPGNITTFTDGNIMVFDWQQASIAPGILDLLHFIQMTYWWYERMPLPPGEIVNRYRQQMAKLNNFNYTDEQWGVLWDYALMWTFMVDWIDILSATPAALIQTRYPLLEKLWFEPVQRAVQRQLSPEG